MSNKVINFILIGTQMNALVSKVECILIKKIKENLNNRYIFSRTSPQPSNIVTIGEALELSSNTKTQTTRREH